MCTRAHEEGGTVCRSVDACVRRCVDGRYDVFRNLQSGEAKALNGRYSRVCSSVSQEEGEAKALSFLRLRVS